MSEWKITTLGEILIIEMEQSPKVDMCNTENTCLALLNGPTEFG